LIIDKNESILFMDIAVMLQVLVVL